MYSIVNKFGKKIATNIESVYHANAMASSIGICSVIDEDKNYVVGSFDKRDFYTNLIFNLVEKGATVDLGKLTICRLKNHYRSGTIKRDGYQVDSEFAENQFSGLFDNLTEACQKFVEIASKLGKI